MLAGTEGLELIPVEVWKAVAGAGALGLLFLVAILLAYRLVDKLIDKIAKATEEKDRRFSEAIGKLDLTLDRVADKLACGDHEIRQDIANAVTFAKDRHNDLVSMLRDTAERVTAPAVQSLKDHVSAEARLTRESLRNAS